MPETKTYLAAGGGLGLLGLLALDRQGQPANLDGLREALQLEREQLQERLEELEEQEEEEEPSAGAKAIKRLNEALQATLSTEADTDVAEAFSADLEEEGGAISSVDEAETGGGNPDYGGLLENTDDSDSTADTSAEPIEYDVDFGGGSYSYSVGVSGDVSSIGDITV